MFQDAVTVEARYQRLIKRVCAAQLVGVLRKPAGWITSESNDLDDTKPLPAWSARAYAAACCQKDRADYAPVSMLLPEFLENWCVGIHQDNGLIAIEMDAHLFGREVEPLQLALQLVEESQRQGKQLPLRKYHTTEAFAALIRAILHD